MCDTAPLILAPDTWRRDETETHAEACARYYEEHDMTLMLKSRKGHSLMIGSTRDLDKSTVLFDAGVSMCTRVRRGSSSMCGGALKRTVGGLVKMDPISLAAIDSNHYDVVLTWVRMVVLLGILVYWSIVLMERSAVLW